MTLDLYKNLKALLKQRIKGTYDTRADEIHPEELPDHYSSMGELLQSLEEMSDIYRIIDAVRAGSFESIGIFGSTDDLEYLLLDAMGLYSR